MYTVKKIWKKFGIAAARDSNCSEKHIKETETHLKRWKEFWKDHKDGKEANRLPGCRRVHLEEWRRSLMPQYSERTVNKHLGTIRRMLVIAEKHEIISSRPRLEQLQEPEKVKLFLRNEQIDSLFEVANKLEWPKVGISPGLWWQCAMVLWRTYGFRTQELIAYETIKRPITWENISFDPRTPNLESDAINKLGWLHYVPPKTRKKKPSPIFLPLTKYTHHALQIMRSVGGSNENPIFNSPRNAERFYGEWYRWMDMAGVRPRNVELKFQPYAMRKTCATFANQHIPGLATAICRWGKSAEAKTASDHYVSDEPLLEKIHEVPMPISFNSFIADNRIAA